MKKLVLLVAAAGVAIALFVYGPITVNVSIDMAGDERADADPTSDSGLAFAATRTGTPNNDTLSGTVNRDFLDGQGGDDTLDGGDGKDKVIGGDGSDTIYGRNGGDDLVGGDYLGQDKLYGGPGDDVLNGLDYDPATAPTPDTLDCGAGAGDFAFYNPGDTLIGCENRSTRWFVIQDTP
jgi:Ca2+-binding RTX toxin-like protein